MLKLLWWLSVWLAAVSSIVGSVTVMRAPSLVSEVGCGLEKKKQLCAPDLGSLRWVLWTLVSRGCVFKKCGDFCTGCSWSSKGSCCLSTFLCTIGQGLQNATRRLDRLSYMHFVSTSPSVILFTIFMSVVNTISAFPAFGHDVDSPTRQPLFQPTSITTNSSLVPLFPSRSHPSIPSFHHQTLPFPSRHLSSFGNIHPTKSSHHSPKPWYSQKVSLHNQHTYTSGTFLGT